MKIITIVLISIISSIIYAQENAIVVTESGASQINNYQNLNAGSGIWIKNINKSKVSGSYYYFNNWKNTAVIYTIDNKGYKLKNVNFNIKDNRLEAQIRNQVADKIFAFNTSDVSKATIGNHTFVSKILPNKPNTLVERLLSSSNANLYKYYENEIKEATVNPMTHQKMGDDKIVLKTTLFLELDGKIKELRLKKNSILTMFKNKEKEIKSYVKENKLSYKAEEDVKKIIDYYNSL